MTRRVQQVLAALEELGEVTGMELAEHLGDMDRYDAHAVLRRMSKRNERTGEKRLYVVRYIYDQEGGRWYPRPVYALGDKPDEKKPGPDHEAVRKRYYERIKAKALTNSVFNLAKQWRKAA